jgi:hypothetical protein
MDAAAAAMAAWMGRASTGVPGGQCRAGGWSELMLVLFGFQKGFPGEEKDSPANVSPSKQNTGGGGGGEGKPTAGEAARGRRRGETAGSGAWIKSAQTDLSSGYPGVVSGFVTTA